MNKTPSDEQQLQSFIRIAQYLANIHSDQDLWHEATRALVQFNWADYACILEKGNDGTIKISGTPNFSDTATALTKDQEAELIAASNEVFESSFISTPQLTGTEPLSTAFLAISSDTKVNNVLFVANRQELPISKKLLDLYLAIAGLIKASHYRIISEKAIVLAKEQAEETSRAKSDFIANMSHEIRTPLNGIMGMLQLLDTTNTDKEQKDYLETAWISTEELMSVINDILDFSKLESGKMELDETQFSLLKLLKTLERAQHAHITAKGLNFSIEISPDAPDLVYADRAELNRILLNLLANAIKFTDCGEVGITVTAEKPVDNHQSTIFCIYDTGIGFGKDMADKLFQPFIQANSGKNRRYGGTGLGLSICKGLASKMGGRIWAESEQGKGSRFYVNIPFRLSSEEMTQSHTFGRTGTSRICAPSENSDYRILVVEDNRINCKFVHSILEKMGFMVDVAENGKEALEIIDSKTFDLVLLDIQMPVMDGEETIHHLRTKEKKIGKHIPVIALTAHAMPTEKDKLLGLGFDGYLAKPLEVSRLRKELNRFFIACPETSDSRPTD